jgi:hypothetical protein
MKSCCSASATNDNIRCCTLHTRVYLGHLPLQDDLLQFVFEGRVVVAARRCGPHCRSPADVIVYVRHEPVDRVPHQHDEARVRVRRQDLAHASGGMVARTRVQDCAKHTQKAMNSYKRQTDPPTHPLSHTTRTLRRISKAKPRRANPAQPRNRAIRALERHHVSGVAGPPRAHAKRPTAPPPRRRGSKNTRTATLLVLCGTTNNSVDPRKNTDSLSRCSPRCW